MATTIHVYMHDADKAEILRALHLLRKTIMATSTEVITILQGAAASQKKTIAEIEQLQTTVTSLNASIVDLQAQVAAGGTISPDLVAAAQQVADLAKQADDEIPDIVPVPTV